MTAAIGFLMIIAIVALLLKGKMSPIVVLAVIPVIAALILGFSPVEVMDFIADGIKTTTSNGILFIFSVIYFGVLADTGLFDVIVGWLVKKAGNNVIAVTVVTALIATIAHLDGTTAVTVLITIPAMYPVYKKMNIDSRILLCLTGACMGVMNLLPWGGPTARAATVLAMDATELWHMLIPLQVVGLMMNIILAVLLGMLAIKHGAGAGKGVEVESDEKEKKEAADLRKSNAYLIFNFLLTVGVIALLSTGIGKSYVIFMLGLCILLAVNYPNQKTQDKLIKKHAPAADHFRNTVCRRCYGRCLRRNRYAGSNGKCDHGDHSGSSWKVRSHHLWYSCASAWSLCWNRRILLWHHAISYAGRRNLWRGFPEYCPDHADR